MELMRSKLCLPHGTGQELIRFKSTTDSNAPYLYNKQHQSTRGLFSQFSYLCHDGLKSDHLEGDPPSRVLSKYLTPFVGYIFPRWL